MTLPDRDEGRRDCRKRSPSPAIRRSSTCRAREAKSCSTSEIIQTIPATRSVGGLLNATPGLTVDNNGIALSPTMTFFSANGGANNEGRMAVNGMTVGAARSGGVSSYVYDAVGVEEVAVRVGGGLGETDTGGPIMNIVPRSGGNTFRGHGVRQHRRRLVARQQPQRRAARPSVSRRPRASSRRTTPASRYGGPILRDRLWFYGQYRNLDTQTAVEGVTANANAGNAARWDWMPSAVNARLVQDRQMAHRPLCRTGRQEPDPGQLRIPEALRGHAADRRRRRLP